MQAQAITNALRESLALDQQSTRPASAPLESGWNDPRARRAEPAPAADQGQNRSSVQEASSERSERSFEEAAKKIQEMLKSFQRDLHFEVHKETGIMYVKVTDVQDGKVLRELPMEQILDTLARIEKVVGLLVDGKA